MTPADLRALRARHDMTIVEFSKAIGISTTMLVDLEKGRVRHRDGTEEPREEIPQLVALAIAGWEAKQ